MEHLKNLLEGAKQVLVLDTGSQYIRPSRNDFSKDMSLLRGDARRISTDMNKVVNGHQNGEQAYNRESK
ncbi:MAG: hypothetical protein EPN17_02480 [Methylobacter sp.]|nr:MAG: hypothetical protein EPN17_02480 [Methylobacter sp.]